MTLPHQEKTHIQHFFEGLQSIDVISYKSTFYLNLITHGFVVLSFVEISPVVQEKKVMIISPLNELWPLIWTNLNSLYPIMYFVKFGWNRSSGSGEEYFKCVTVLLLFCLLSPCKGARPFVWTNLNTRHQQIHCATLFGIFPAVLEKKMNAYANDANSNDDGKC